MTFSPTIHFEDSEVWVKGNKIEYVGPNKISNDKFDREVDLKGNVLMPGFKNAHSHTAMTFLRSFADDKPLQNWLVEDVFPNEAKLTDEAIYYFAKLGILEYLTSGITSCFDMYFHNDAYSQACVDSSFRTVICSAFNNFDKDPENIEREYIKFNNYDELVAYRLGIHAEYTTSMERMKYMVSLAEKYKAPCYAHVAETKNEVDGCIERYGATPVKLLSDIGLYQFGGGAFHCCYVTDEDINILLQNNIGIVTNPASNLKLASGIAPITKMKESGIKIGIGTDGAASNNALDFFREMYLATALQKLSNEDASSLPAEDVLTMACQNGSDIMGIENCDDIAEGKLADLIVIDINQPNMRPINNTIKNIVYSGAKTNVKMTMVNGKVLYEDGNFFIGEDIETIFSMSQKLADGIKN